MEIIKPGVNVDFMKGRMAALAVSLSLIVISLFGILVWPKPNAGIDFAGGHNIQIHFEKPVDIADLRAAVDSMDMGDVTVQEVTNLTGGHTNTFLIRVEELGIEHEIMMKPAQEPGKDKPFPVKNQGESGDKSASYKTMLAQAEPEPGSSVAGAETGAAAPDSSPAMAPAAEVGSSAEMAEPEPPAAEVGSSAEMAEPATGSSAAPDASAEPGSSASPEAGASVADGGTGQAAAPGQPVEAPEHTPTPLEKKLAEKFGKDSFTILKTDYVGPRVGANLRNRGVMAIGLAMALILVYITLRFEFRFALGAVIALIHDVIITTGAFVWTGKEFNLAIIAALLTIIGYSLNDTIVLFDRVRDNVRRMKRMGFAEMINSSINEVLSRTILTSVTTFIVVFFLWLLGADVIRDFAFALMVGVIVGTYSSIFVAGSFVIWWEKMREQRRSPAVESAKAKAK